MMRCVAFPEHDAKLWVKEGGWEEELLSTEGESTVTGTGPASLGRRDTSRMTDHSKKERLRRGVIC